ncbi:glycoside hydrolase family 97 protein [bacterium]|nr:MAG: glycoside hydrolase family 97 protein [bacterium]
MHNGRIVPLLMLFSLFTCASAEVKVTSPGRTHTVSFRLGKDGTPQWQVTHQGTILLSWSSLGLTFLHSGPLGSNLVMKNSAVVDHDETYQLVAGKTREARDRYRELRVTLTESVRPFRRLEVLFRAYDDGVAFRYVLPLQDSLPTVDILQENTEFRFPGDLKAWPFQINTFHSSFEGQYLPTLLSAIPDTGLVSLPLTLQRQDGLTMAIVEAELVNYAGMYLRGMAGTALRVVLPPWPDGSGIVVRGKPPLSSPWRVIMVGQRAGDLIESTIIQNLSSPSVLRDVSWIRPGKAVFPWWPNFFCDKPGIPGKLCFENQKYYIDFASENNIDYLELEPPWYGDEEGCINNPEKYDITQPVPELRLRELFDYAREKHVGLFLWAHWKNVERQADRAFPLYEKWGAVGVKIDFMNRDDQEMIQWYQKILRKAADHHLMVYFHGVSKPTGSQRTYPNLLTQEGVLGNEQNKVISLITPEHTVTLPFTRMLTGPMDFTPGGFRNVTMEEFKPDWNRPAVMGTRCHQLAMFVVYESPLMMVCDDPAAYRGQAGLDFIRDVPTSWDQTKVIDGQIGEYVILARRKGDEWFLGAMGNSSAREVHIPVTFLGEGEYRAAIYQDGPDADRQPTDIAFSRRMVTRDSLLSVRLAGGGGLAVRFQK